MDKLLVQFLAVAETGTITGAADSLLIAQPTLTANLQKLEKSLGVQLFERSARGVKLTRYGGALYENVARMQRLYNNAVGTIERLRVQEEEGLSIGSGYTWWSLFLEEFVLDYGRRFPKASVNVTLGHTLRCMDQLITGDIGLFVGHRINDLSPSAHAHFVEIGPVRDGFFVRDGHPLLECRRSQADVRRYPTALAFPPDTRQQRLLLDHDYTLGDVQQPEHLGHAFTSNSLEACLAYVRSSDAVIRHTELISDNFRAKGLRQVEMFEGDEPPYRPMGLYLMPERLGDPRVMSLVETIGEGLRKLVQQPMETVNR